MFTLTLVILVCCGYCQAGLVASGHWFSPILTNSEVYVNAYGVQVSNVIAVGYLRPENVVVSSQRISQTLTPFPTNTMGYRIWTNAVAFHTGTAVGRFVTAWPSGFTYDYTNAPTLHYSHSNMLWGAHGYESVSVYCPYNSSTPYTTLRTLVTKRHALCCRHGGGGWGSGLVTNCPSLGWGHPCGAYVWFMNTNDVMFRKKIVAVYELPSGDASVALMESDIDSSITPMPMIEGVIAGYYPALLPSDYNGQLMLTKESRWNSIITQCPHALLGDAAVGVYTLNGMTVYGPSPTQFHGMCSEGGSSGSPFMVDLPPNRQIAYWGTCSGGATLDDWQAAIDLMSVDAGLNTNDYQITRLHPE